jgi:hypothetical protein
MAGLKNGMSGKGSIRFNPSAQKAKDIQARKK